ncbi:WD40 repeat-like protein [Trametes elegans]|nr:WD40 repeat-like protein [Trametes elegans]
MANESAKPILLPICTVQHDFQDIVKDVSDGVVPEDSFWVSCYKQGEPSVHGKSTAALDEHDRNLVLYKGRDGVQFKNHGKDLYSVACPSLDIADTRVAVPSKAYLITTETRKQTQITAFDVAPDGAQIATGHHDGSVFLRPTASSSAVPSAAGRPHLSTVTSLRFFPSSRVLLTAGADFSLSILSADLPETSSYTTTKAVPARTLRGHTRAVTSTAIISRGRNVLSASKDGSIRLWDMPSGSQIRTLAAGSNHFVPVLALSASERPAGVVSEESTPSEVDPREVETADKVVFAGLQDGTFELFDLRTKRAVFRSRLASTPVGSARAALQALAYSPEHALLATGTAAGLAAVYDARALGDGPLATFRRNEAPIEDVAFVDLSGTRFDLASSASAAEGAEADAPAGVGLAIATEDGLPYVAEVRPSGPRVWAELLGTDCDAVRFVRVVGRDIWSAADDGVVRRYAL